MAPMMMKLKLAAISFGVAQAATKICAEDGAFDGTKMVQGETPIACAMVEQLLPAFTATAESCAADIKLGDGEPQAAGKVMAGFSVCCKTGSDVCSAFGTSSFSTNPCATASDYKPDHSFVVDESDGQKWKCSMVAAELGQFTPTATTCFEKRKDGSDESKAMFTGLAAANGCCGTGKSTCAQFLVSPCADKTKFLPDAKSDGKPDGMACSAAMTVVAPFTPTTETCDATMTIDGKADARKKHLADVAAFCCSDKVSICVNPGSKPSGGSSADSSVSSGSVGACVANIFFAMVALVPHMLA